jgi:hypothetical protein
VTYSSKKNQNHQKKLVSSDVNSSGLALPGKVFRLPSQFVALLSILMFGFVSTSSSAMSKKTYCVFDPVGANGAVFQKMRDYQAAALDWGVEFSLKPYTDERVAEEDFKSGQCDAVGLTGARGRKFNSFTGTLDAIGAIPTYGHMAVALKTLAKERAAPLMRAGENDEYEVVGIIPGGQVFLYVNDREVDSVSEMSGKKIGHSRV